jgi:hypothetical protein
MKRVFILLSVAASVLCGTSIDAQVIVQVTDPLPVQGFLNFGTANGWGADLNDPANAVSGTGVLVSDGTAADSLGCGTLVNAANVAGNIAFVYRGTCEFGVKALNAQNAGAIAVVIINNVSGTIPMGAGSQGGNVTIPVVMISKEDGELLRPYLDNGTLEMFIGSKLGLFANDLGSQKGDIIRPLSYSVPSLLAGNSAELNTLLLGAKVRNFGSNTQTNINLNAKIVLNGTTQLYNQTASLASLAPGDSFSFSLNPFSIPNANVAKYTLTYTITSDSTDQDTSDNVLTQDFYVSDGVYSKSGYDFAAGKPIRTSGITSANSSAKKWGILMNAESGSQIKVTGIQFSASTRSTDSLTGQVVTGYVYEWDDINQDGGITNNELTEISIGFYSYESDLQNEFITIEFDDMPGLADNKIYYFAVEYEGNLTFFYGIDGNLDYAATIDAYSQSINPLYTDTWYGGGFGTENTLAIAVLTEFNNVSVNEETLSLSMKAYPNPANDAVNLVFGDAVSNANVQVNVIDVTGRSVMNNQFAITGAANYVRVNTATLAPGAYYFRVSLNGNPVSSIPVVIAR